MPVSIYGTGMRLPSLHDKPIDLRAVRTIISEASLGLRLGKVPGALAPADASGARLPEILPSGIVCHLEVSADRDQ